MKKGLLSLLAVALTVVGCQNYDDQFQSLTDQITELSTQVEGLSAVRGQVTALAGVVDGLVTALQTVDNEVGAVATQLGEVSSDVDAVSSTLSDVHADGETQLEQLGTISTTLGNILAELDAVDLTLEQLLVISSTLADVEADVHELLQAGAVIDQNVVITNAAQLEYAEELIATEEDSPLVIINGYVKIDTDFTPDITTEQLASVNAIASQIKTILGEGTGGTRGLEVDAETELNFNRLVFVDDDYDIDGVQPNDSLLRTVSGDLLLGLNGDIDYSQLASVGGSVVLTAAAAATATTINFADVIIEGALTHGTGTVLNFPNANTVNLGSAAFTSLTAARAGTVVSALSETASDLIISAAAGGDVHVRSLESVGGNFSVSGATTTTLDASSLETITGTSTIVAGTVDLSALTATGAADFTAETSINLSGLVTVTNAMDLNDTPAATLTALGTINNSFTWDIATISLPGVDVNDAGAGEILSATGTNVTVGSVDVISDAVATAETLVLTAQDANIAEGGAYATVTNLTITAASDAAISYTDANFTGVTTLATTDVDTLTLSNATLTNFDATNGLYIDIAAASGVDTATTSGDLIRFISAGTSLAEWNNTANVKDDPDVLSGEEAVTIDIASSLLESIDLSSMNKVRVVNLPSTNANLVEVIAPSTDNLLTPGAEPDFNIFLTTTVTYTAAVLAVEDGVNPRVDFIEACLHAPGVSTWPAYITAVLDANPTATTTIDFDTVVEIDSSGAVSATHADIAAAFTADSANNDLSSDGRTATGVPHVGTIGSQAELAILSATACSN